MTRSVHSRQRSLALSIVDDQYQYRNASSEPESDEQGLSMPSSPSSVSSDTSTESWSNMSQLSQSASRVIRHPEYYIDTGDVVFLVESTLFRVHRHFFIRESQRFRDLIYGYGRGGPTSVGFSAVNPIELSDDGVTAEEFSHFLWVFYNPEYKYDAPVAQWASILRLSHIWGFAKVKALAIREMDTLEIPPVDRAVWAREFDVDPQRRWLEQAYAALGARAEPLTKSEGLRLGLDAVLQLAQVREQIRERRQAAPAVLPRPLPRAQQLPPDVLFEQRSSRGSRRSRAEPTAPPLASWESYNPATEPEAEAVSSKSSRCASPAMSDYDEEVEEEYVPPPPPPAPRPLPTPSHDPRHGHGTPRKSRQANEAFDSASAAAPSKVLAPPPPHPGYCPEEDEEA